MRERDREREREIDRQTDRRRSTHAGQMAAGHGQSDDQRLAAQFIAVGVRGGADGEDEEEGQQDLDPQPLPRG